MCFADDSAKFIVCPMIVFFTPEYAIRKIPRSVFYRIELLNCFSLDGVACCHQQHNSAEDTRAEPSVNVKPKQYCYFLVAYTFIQKRKLFHFQNHFSRNKMPVLCNSKCGKNAILKVSQFV